MSVVPLSWVLKKSPVDEPSDRLVLIALADCAHDDGTNAFPSVETLATMARVSERTVQRALNRLVKGGAIRLDGKAPNGSQTNCYTILMVEGCQADTRQSDGGVTSDVEGVSPVTPGGVTRDTQPINEPSKEPSLDMTMVVCDEHRETGHDEPPGELARVLSILDDTAQKKGVKRPKPDGVLAVLLEFKDKNCVKAAESLRWWLLHSEKGRARKKPDIAATFRTFVCRADDKTQEQTSNEDSYNFFNDLTLRRAI